MIIMAPNCPKVVNINYCCVLPPNKCLVESSLLFDDTCIYSPSPLRVDQNVDLDVKVGTKKYTVKITSMTQVKSADPQLLNIIFNKALNASDLQRIGRGHYEKKEMDLSAFHKTEEKLQIFPGFHSEVLSKLVASQRDLIPLVNIDPISKVLCKGITCCFTCDTNLILISQILWLMSSTIYKTTNLGQQT